MELEVEAGRTIIRSTGQPVRGRDEHFERMAAEGDDEILDPSVSSAREAAEGERD